jgi:hypothetical protein
VACDDRRGQHNATQTTKRVTYGIGFSPLLDEDATTRRLCCSHDVSSMPGGAYVASYTDKRPSLGSHEENVDKSILHNASRQLHWHSRGQGTSYK